MSTGKKVEITSAKRITLQRATIGNVMSYKARVMGMVGVMRCRWSAGKGARRLWAWRKITSYFLTGDVHNPGTSTSVFFLVKPDWTCYYIMTDLDRYYWAECLDECDFCADNDIELGRLPLVEGRLFELTTFSGSFHDTLYVPLNTAHVEVIKAAVHEYTGKTR